MDSAFEIAREAFLLGLHVQHGTPAAERLANWLPCPPGPLGLTFRTYLPGEAIRSGAWTPPPVEPHDQERP